MTGRDATTKGDLEGFVHKDAGQARHHIHISSKHKLLDLRLKEVWEYRDLIVLYARRTLVSSYKQTILGPAWLIMNPIITSVIYMVIFGQVARFSTGGAPQIVFYMLGNALWSFFSGSYNASADTLIFNSYVFTKVYFPRLTLVMSDTLVHLFHLATQFVLSVLLGLYFMFTTDFSFTFSRWPCLIPLMVLVATIGMGFGLIMSSLTVRYRDLRMVGIYVVRLWMYVTPVLYPLSQFGNGFLRTVILANPLTGPFEAIRWCLWGAPAPPVASLAYAVVVAVVAMFVGLIVFCRAERTFADTV